MVEIRIARPARQADAYVPNSSARTRPVVAALDRIAGTVSGIQRQEAEDDEADLQAAHRIEMERLERERAATIADRAGAFAEFRAGLDQYANETRVGPDAKPGAAGHGDQVASEVERRTAEFRATLGNDPEVIARFEPLLRGEAAATVGRERAWELQEFAKYQTGNWQKYRDSTAIQLQEVPSAAAFKSALSQSELLIDGMKLSGTARQTLKDDAGNLFANTVLKAQLDAGNTAQVRELLTLPKIKTDVKPKVAGNINIYDRPSVRNADGIVSTVRTISFGTDEGEVLVPTVADDGTIMTDDEAIQHYYDTGNHLGIFASPDEATRYAEALHDQQAAMGDSPAAFMTKFLTPQERAGLLKAADLADQRAAAEVEQAQREQVSAAREAVRTVKELIAQGVQPTAEQMKAVENAGAALPPSEKVELAGLAIGVDVAKRTQGWSAAQLQSWSTALQAKVDAGAASRWEQMALQHVRARYDHVADSDADTNKEVVKTPQGRLALVNSLAASPDRAAAFDAAQRAQPGLGQVMLLPTKAARQMAIEGREIRKAQPDLVPMDKATMAFRATLGRVAGLLGDEFDDKLGLAADLYAQSASRHGLTKDRFDAEGFGQMVQLAMGATWQDGVRRGGIGRVNGGAVLLPDQSTERGFARTVARATYDGAVDGSGRAVPKAWIVGHMVPVFQRDDADGRAVYYLVDASGRYLQHRDGGPYALFVK
ncbi:hypothetical protein [Sphingopyxis sp. SCN 67-31]|uniref:hypothetical protein n=1 Tax=Sphingopyxis sp. SCN 67-31 TaxID=1660142 RepID=UPI00086C7372|nr:hypothetical protein [Sphingopyxis sp. SCN 67-31]ODU28987.1 MAG: hypothetical protein ABS88_10680 [Sphingopyxis sp. SCN 67-31]